MVQSHTVFARWRNGGKFKFQTRNLEKLTTFCVSLTLKSLLETEAEELSRASQSPLGNLRKKHHVLTPRQSERTLGIAEPASSKQKSKSKLGGIGL